jgi:hypothetical protein
MKSKIGILFGVLFFCISKIASQETAQIEILWSDEAILEFVENNPVKRLIGHVKLRHKGTLFFCDKAINMKSQSEYIHRQAGHLSKYDGYIQIRVENKLYRAHHLAWLYCFGYLPRELDHINGIRVDNRIENLREVTHAENGRNTKRHSTNTSGVTGVYYNKINKYWVAQIRINYKTIYLGCFKDIEDAILARKAAETEFGFHPNHGRIIYNV